MAPEIRDWSIPAPVRALMWWPAVAFALFVITPDASIGLIIGAGLVLAAFGVLIAAARKRMTGEAPAPDLVETTVEFPVTEMPRVADERAA